MVRGEVAFSRGLSLVSIQPSGSLPPFFCMHAHGGNALEYRHLSRCLGPDRPFYGLQSRGLDGTCAPLERIEDMARLYISEIRQVQRHGPYFVGGHCMGGTLALEVAQQLHTAGEPVALLALFDTMNWAAGKRPTAWQKRYHRCERILFHAANLFSMDSGARRRFLRAGASSPGSDVLRRIAEVNWYACANYVPRPYPGKITDFRPARQYRRFRQPGLKWDKLALGGQEIVVLPVNPQGMLIEPFVAHLASALRHAVDRALLAWKQ